MSNEGWKSIEAVKYFMKIADVLIPGRTEILSTIGKLTGSIEYENLFVLDLGCGYGDLTAEILKHKSNAKIVMLDYSNEMIKICKMRFSGNDNIEIFEADLNNGLPDIIENYKFNIVVSSFSLHHIEFKNRVILYKSIYEHLVNEGIFANGDMFIGESSKINDWEFDKWIEWMRIQIKEKLGKEATFEQVKERQLDSFKRLGDKPESIWNMRNDIITSGFKNFDCLCKYQNQALIVASK